MTHIQMESSYTQTIYLLYHIYPTITDFTAYSAITPNIELSRHKLTSNIPFNLPPTTESPGYGASSRQKRQPYPFLTYTPVSNESKVSRTTQDSNSRSLLDSIPTGQISHNSSVTKFSSIVSPLPQPNASISPPYQNLAYYTIDTHLPPR